MSHGRLYWAWRKWRALVGMFVQDGLPAHARVSRFHLFG